MSEIDPLGPEADKLFAEQLAIMASTYFEMGKARSEVRDASIGFWQQVHAPAGMFAAAASSVATLPQPLQESTEESERRRAIRERFGQTSTEDQLLSMLAARELMEELAGELG